MSSFMSDLKAKGTRIKDQGKWLQACHPAMDLPGLFSIL